MKCKDPRELVSTQRDFPCRRLPVCQRLTLTILYIQKVVMSLAFTRAPYVLLRLFSPPHSRLARRTVDHVNAKRDHDDRQSHFHTTDRGLDLGIASGEICTSARHAGQTKGLEYRGASLTHSARNNMHRKPVLSKTTSTPLKGKAPHCCTRSRRKRISRHGGTHQFRNHTTLIRGASV